MAKVCAFLEQLASIKIKTTFKTQIFENHRISAHHLELKVRLYTYLESACSLGKWHGVADRITIKDNETDSANNARLKFSNRLVDPDFGDFDFTRDGIAGPDRRLEAPVHLQEHCTRSRQIFGHDRV